jgi:hypothetical protein
MAQQDLPFSCSFSAAGLITIAARLLHSKYGTLLFLSPRVLSNNSCSLLCSRCREILFPTKARIGTPDKEREREGERLASLISTVPAKSFPVL